MTVSTPVVKHRNNGMSQRVLSYLRDYPYEVVAHSEISKALGATPEQVSNAIIHLMSRTNIPVTRPMRGMAVYSPQRASDVRPVEPVEPVPAPRTPADLYELVGQSNGRKIVRSEDGELWVLMPLFLPPRKEGN